MCRRASWKASSGCRSRAPAFHLRRRCGSPRSTRRAPSASTIVARSRPIGARTSYGSAWSRTHRSCARSGAKVSGLSEPNGPLVYVMGPSGAGKDSVLNRARTLLAEKAPVVFAHRYITRPAEAGGENHIELSPTEFGLRRTHGLFAFHWRAHGNEYGIGREVYSWRRAGLTVVVSGSREHFRQVGGVDDNTIRC